MAFVWEIKKWDVLAVVGRKKVYYGKTGDHDGRKGESSIEERDIMLSSSTGLCAPINSLKQGG